MSLGLSETETQDAVLAPVDIAGTAQSGSAEKWRNNGTTGFGTRLLLDFALNFRA